MRSPHRAAAPASLTLVLLASLAGSGCDDTQPLPEARDAALPAQSPAESEGGCVECHPRQVDEWLGSSHNYGGGLDGTFQALELVANYHAAHLTGRPTFRQNQLCIACHAPSIALYDPATGVVDINTTLREGDGERRGAFGRELPYPADGADLLMPLGALIEQTPLGEDADALAPPAQRLLSFQGISCDTCHKVGQPHDDRFGEAHPDLSVCMPGDDLEACLAEQYAECEDPDAPYDPRCLRRSREQHPHQDPVFDPVVATVALPVERDGDTRYGPFAEGDAAPAEAHDVSNGVMFDLAQHPDGRPFEGQDPDERPFIQSSHFCGTCHDVRLPPLPGTDDDPERAGGPLSRNNRLEPVHNEPFLRLENLFTEWFQSPLNLHPDAKGDDPDRPWPDNPYRDADGNPRRVVCQDCHMSLHPFAPPGTYPGAYTHPQECDELDGCGLTIATQGARADLRIKNRPRVTTHNMTGVDIALGNLRATNRDLVGYPSTDIVNNEAGNGAVDDVYGLPKGLDLRRRALLHNAVSVSLAGTPETLDTSPDNCGSIIDPDTGEPERDPATGDVVTRCNLPVKVWTTNVNGGHNIAAGFSQERQIWVEFTIQDTGGERVGEGMMPVVDCALAEIDDLYRSEDNSGRYPTREPRLHTVDSANETFDRLTGLRTDLPLDAHQDFHPRICRGLSGHLMDKPHDETHEPNADDNLADEDIMLHRIGNTVPVLVDGTKLLSWHIADLGFDYAATEPPSRAPGAGPGGPVDIDSARVTRADQFHIAGLNAYACQLTEDHKDTTLGARADLPVTTLDGRSLPLTEMEDYARSVTTTPDERLEILYPFPEFPPLLPHHDAQGDFHFGERFGLIYLTNIFYQTCGCEHGDCEGPEEIPITFGHLYDSQGAPRPQRNYDARGRPIAEDVLHAQVPWVKTYPALPHTDGHANHFPLSGPVPESTPEAYYDLLDALAAADPKIEPCEGGGACGTTYREAFTFIPLNADHMPNNRALRMYRPQRHYYDIRVPIGDTTLPGARGPLRISVKVWYRHFPPEFLRLMARFMDGAYRRATAEGTAEAYFPHGPLVVEGLAARLFPGAADIDNVQRVLLDEAVFYVDVPGSRVETPAEPSWADIEPIIADNCLPCHSDALRHGGLVLGYDAYPTYDDPVGQPGPHAAQDARANLVGAAARHADGRQLVVPGDPDASLLMALLTRDEAALEADGVRSRPMPLGTDRLADRDIELIRRWIAQGARP